MEELGLLHPERERGHPLGDDAGVELAHVTVRGEPYRLVQARWDTNHVAHGLHREERRALRYELDLLHLDEIVDNLARAFVDLVGEPRNRLRGERAGNDLSVPGVPRGVHREEERCLQLHLVGHRGKAHTGPRDEVVIVLADVRDLCSTGERPEAFLPVEVVARYLERRLPGNGRILSEPRERLLPLFPRPAPERHRRDVPVGRERVLIREVRRHDCATPNVATPASTTHALDRVERSPMRWAGDRAVG
ncbi:unannotated protein [freshwater metagenome]|uniref:Unannotated protein n=1 Tax=freshwater metagenome TaxID=449393 RepID=A0A6J6ZZZ9_9ZZZZ